MTTKVKKLGRRARVADAAPRLLAARLRDIKDLAATPPTLASVHAMRVATRRLRAALQLFGGPRALSRELKRLQDALGAVRDAQLHSRWLGAELPQRTRALAAAVQEFSQRTAPRVAKAELAQRGRLGGHRLRKELRRKLRAVEKRTQAGALSPLLAHQLRIAVKKLRYRAELLRQALPLSGLLAELEPLQEALGELHDLDVRRTLEPGREGAAREKKAAALAQLLEHWRAQGTGRAFHRALR